MKLFPTEGKNLSLIGRYIGYPIGKIGLRVVTLGHYPPENKKHNELLVSMFSWAFFCVFSVVYWS